MNQVFLVDEEEFKPNTRKADKKKEKECLRHYRGYPVPPPLEIVEEYRILPNPRRVVREYEVGWVQHLRCREDRVAWGNLE